MPMVLLFPRLFDLRGGASLLGLGDMALPGLFIAYTLRFDYISGTTAHFRTALAGYALGLLLTDVALVVTHVGQPALLYIVPCCVGGVWLQARRLGTLQALWNGLDEDTPEDRQTLV